MKYDLYINDTIGWPISAAYVRSILSKLKAEEECAVYINSFGGSVSDGLDIRQQFIDHGNVTAFIHGMTASAATILAMGAKRIVMGRYSLLLVHPCSQWQEEWGQMNASEIEDAIARLKKSQDDLQTIDHVIASLYAQRTGKPLAEMQDAMTSARWLTADEALALGLVDDILEEETPEDVTAFSKARIVACGLPLPQRFKAAEKPSVLEKIQKQLSEMRSFFRAESKEEEGEELKLENTFIKITMNKNFTTINALLKVEGVEASEGKILLTEEQVTALEASLADAEKKTEEKEAERAALASEIETLKAQIEALQKGDGDDTLEVRSETPEAEEPSAGLASAQKSYQKISGLL